MLEFGEIRLSVELSTLEARFVPSAGSRMRSLEFIAEDECAEVTPKTNWIRKVVFARAPAPEDSQPSPQEGCGWLIAAPRLWVVRRPGCRVRAQ